MVLKMFTMYGADRPSTLINDYAEYRIWEDLLKNDEFSENFRNQADKSENFPLGADHTCLKSRIRR